MRVLSGIITVLGLFIGSRRALQRTARSPRRDTSDDQPAAEDADAVAGSASGASTAGSVASDNTGDFVFGDERSDDGEDDTSGSDYESS